MNKPLWIAASLLIGSAAATAASNQQPSAKMNEVKVRDLIKNPDKFADSQVRVTGRVTRIEGPGAFIVEGDGLLNNKILAVVETPRQSEDPVQQPGSVIPTIKENEKVQLTGRVEEMGVARIEKNYTQLEADIKAEFEGNMSVLLVPPKGIKVLD